MPLLYLMLGAGVALTLVSGQYGDHNVLFWAFIASVFLTAGFYKNQRNVAEGRVEFSLTMRRVIEFGTGVFGFLSSILFAWMMIVIWF